MKIRLSSCEKQQGERSGQLEQDNVELGAGYLREVALVVICFLLTKLKYFCAFLCSNHQVDGDFLISLYTNTTGCPVRKHSFD
jgi:hypothetical protein